LEWWHLRRCTGGWPNTSCNDRMAASRIGPCETTLAGFAIDDVQAVTIGEPNVQDDDAGTELLGESEASSALPASPTTRRPSWASSRVCRPPARARGRRLSEPRSPKLPLAHPGAYMTLPMTLAQLALGPPITAVSVTTAPLSLRRGSTNPLRNRDLDLKDRDSMRVKRDAARDFAVPSPELPIRRTSSQLSRSSTTAERAPSGGGRP
jgi:hypothetical protein